MEAVHEDRRLRVAARHQERGQKVTPTSRTAASSSKAAGRMRRRGTVESIMTLHPYAPVPGTQLGQWSYARVLCFLGQAASGCKTLGEGGYTNVSYAADTRSSESLQQAPPAPGQSPAELGLA